MTYNFSTTTMNPNYLFHNLVYAAIIPVVFVSLCFFLPIFFIFKFMYTIYRYLSREIIKGKVVLITGASSGIGEELAYEYAKRGASLVIVARREKELQRVAERARGLGSPDVLPICADVSNVHDCKRFVEEAINHFGRLDHLVNNAGISSVCPFEDATDVTNFEPVMGINFWGSIYPTYYAIPHLKKSRGKIIVNSSAAALLQPPRCGLYSASKAALLSFYETLRVELGPAITITIVTLGFVESEMTLGKHLSKGGVVQVNRQLADAVRQAMPFMSSRACAKAIVEAVGRRERYVTEPKWYTLFFLLKYLCPELVEWYYRTFNFKPSNHSFDDVLSENKVD